MAQNKELRYVREGKESLSRKTFKILPFPQSLPEEKAASPTICS